MIHEVAYIEKLKTEYSELLKTCLGKQLVSAKRRFYQSDDILLAYSDTVEVVLTFSEPETSLYFTWEQLNCEFYLSVQDKSNVESFQQFQFSELQAQDDNILLKSLGKIFTLFEMYEDKFGCPLAALLRFENESFVVAVGHSKPPTPDDIKGEFFNFYGDDFYLWTVEEFQRALQKHKLEVTLRANVSTSI